MYHTALIRKLYAAFIFLSLTFYDYFKYSGNFRGIQLNNIDVIGVGFVFVSALSILILLQKSDSYKLSRFGWLVLSVFALTLLMKVFWFDNYEVIPYKYASVGYDAWGGYLSESLKVIKLFIGYLLVSYIFSRFVSVKTIVKVILISAAVHLIFGVHQILYFAGIVSPNALPIQVGEQVGNSFNLVFGRATGLLTNPFPFGLYMLLSGLLSIALYRVTGRKIWGVVVSVFVLGSLLSGSRSLLIAWCVVAVFYFAYTRRKALYIFNAALVGIVFVVFVNYYLIYTDFVERRLTNTNSYSSRMETNISAFDAFLRSPLFGYGKGHNVYTDSTYATLLLEGGLIGLMGFVLFWGWLLIRSKRVSSVCLLKRDLYGYELSLALYTFMIIFFIQSALLSGVERMPVLLAMMLLFFGLNSRVKLGRVIYERRGNLRKN